MEGGFLIKIKKGVFLKYVSFLAIIYMFSKKLDVVGPVDNRPYTD